MIIITPYNRLISDLLICVYSRKSRHIDLTFCSDLLVCQYEKKMKNINADNSAFCILYHVLRLNLKYAMDRYIYCYNEV